MKKTYFIFCLVVLLGVVSPVFATPPQGHTENLQSLQHPKMMINNHKMDRGLRVPPPPAHHLSSHFNHKAPIFSVGYVRRNYWRSPYYCDYRLGFCDGYYTFNFPHYYSNGVSINFVIPRF